MLFMAQFTCVHKAEIPLLLKELFTDFSDELARASQVTPNVVVCGDFNAKIGNLCEVTDAHVGALVACPALQLHRLRLHGVTFSQIVRLIGL